MRFGILICALAVSVCVAWAEPPVVTWDKAETMVGQQCIVEGQVLQTDKTEEACYLHFSKKLKTDFTVVIFAINFPRWPGDIDGMYRGKTVRATGVVQQFRGRPELVVSDPSQITVVNTGTATAGATTAPPGPTGTNVTTGPVTNVVAAPPALGFLPFTVDVKRFSGARRGTGGGESFYGSAFRQRSFIEINLQNTSTQLVTDVSWQWVAVVMSVGGGQDQYYQGSESQIELKPFETRTLKSDEIKMGGQTSMRYGMTSGTKLRGHYVKVTYKGHVVFREAMPPDLERDAEAYLDKLQRQATPKR